MNETFIQPKIIGYTQLSEAQADLMNEGKALANQVGAFVDKLRGHESAGGKRFGESAGTMPPLDQRWISIGVTQLQQGFMAVLRGIAQPDSF